MRALSVSFGLFFLASVAAVQAPAAQASSGPQATEPAARPNANLAQLMRAIMFPNSNIIFNVQSQDPGEPMPVYEPGSGGFSWVAWGAGIYTGWELVENAAIALDEATDLIMKPGRLCTNGRPVPLEQPDFVQGVQRLREVAAAALEAARAKSQERVSDVTNQLAEACYDCHQVHRIDPPGGPRRCVP